MKSQQIERGNGHNMDSQKQVDCRRFCCCASQRALTFALASISCRDWFREALRQHEDGQQHHGARPSHNVTQHQKVKKEGSEGHHGLAAGTTIQQV
jgi:hypothetical protein